jgi:hypothetical protein
LARLEYYRIAIGISNGSIGEPKRLVLVRMTPAVHEEMLPVGGAETAMRDWIRQQRRSAVAPESGTDRRTLAGREAEEG